MVGWLIFGYCFNDSWWHICIAASRLHRRLVVGVGMMKAVEFDTSPVPDNMLANCGNHNCTDTVYLDAVIWRLGSVHFGNLSNSIQFNANYPNIKNIYIYRRRSILLVKNFQTNLQITKYHQKKPIHSYPSTLLIPISYFFF